VTGAFDLQTQESNQQRLTNIVWKFYQ